MRTYISRKFCLLISSILLLTAVQVLQSCSSDDEEEFVNVDLRYRAEDAYTVEAQKPAPIIIQVKSTHPWEVYGEENWYTISPATGEPGETYDVTIQCKENSTQSERVGKIYIKSDYWIGKEITITQKAGATTAP